MLSHQIEQGHPVYNWKKPTHLFIQFGLEINELTSWENDPVGLATILASLVMDELGFQFILLLPLRCFGEIIYLYQN